MRFYALGAAAIGLLLASTAAQAQEQQTTVRQSTCQSQWSPGGWQTSCTSAAPPQPEAPFKRGAATQTTVRYTPPGTEQKRAAGPIASDLCRQPYHMTERDGCQR